jgi:hypothetical protein
VIQRAPDSSPNGHFAHLQVHSEFSLLDGLSRLAALTRRAAPLLAYRGGALEDGRMHLHRPEAHGVLAGERGNALRARDRARR